MIRVLHVVRNMNRGGAETLIMNLFRNIDRSKIMFDFLVQSEQKGDFEDEIISLGGKLHRIKYVTDVGCLGYLKELNKFFAEHKEYKIVHSHMNSLSGLILKAAKNQGIPNRIAHSHNTKNSGNILIKTYKFLIAGYIKNAATNYFACSEKAGKWLFRNVEKKKIEVIYNGIDTGIFKFDKKLRDEKRKELKLENKLVIGHVGAFTKQKNHKFIIKIFSELYKKNDSAHLVLVGDGPLKKQIDKLVTFYKLENCVEFLGIRKDINALMNAFDIFLFPSLYEGLPVVLVEAQFCGLSCLIAGDIGKEADIGMNLLISIDSIKETELWVKGLLETKRIIQEIHLVNTIFDIKGTAKALSNKYSEMDKG